MKLTKPELMLLALLRASVHDGNVMHEHFADVSAAEWKKCYDTAAKQGVLALAWDGVLKLPKEMRPAKPLMIQWGLTVEKFEAKHRQYCKTVQELQQFYREHGIVAVQMKGVGFSANYHRPEHREGGDIDIFTYSADTSKMSHKDANILADNLMEQKGEEVDLHSYKHSNFFFKGIPVENHKFFLNVQMNKTLLGGLNSLLHKLLNPVEVTLYNGEYRILVPSSEFNTIFISCHAFQHYGSGISLHHLYDWAALLRNYGLNLPAQVTNTNFLRAIAAFTHLSNIYLGTEIKLDNFPQGYETMADEMLKEMLAPVYTKVVPYTGKARILAYKTRKVFRSAKLANDVFGASFAGRIMESVIAHIKNPSTIFSRGEK